MTESWWLKFQRAEKHMVDIQEEARRYAERDPYEFTRIRVHDRHQQIRGRFRITNQPDPLIAIMLGDFIHNLRSALDWVVVACAPKNRLSKAGFPIVSDDIFAEDGDGNFVVNDTNRIRNFETLVEGLHPEARAFIIGLQPYQATNWGLDVNAHILGIINRLENADKHRKIITLGCGGRDFFLYLSYLGLPPIRFNQPLGIGSQFVKDNTVIPYDFPSDGINLPDGSPVKPSDMDVHFKGTVKILVEIPRLGGNQKAHLHLLDSLMDSAIFDVRQILTRLESFARND